MHRTRAHWEDHRLGDTGHAAERLTRCGLPPRSLRAPGPGRAGRPHLPLQRGLGEHRG